MEKNEEISRILQDHEKRIVALEANISTPRVAKRIKNNKSLPDHIHDLREEGLLSQALTIGEVHTRLQERYPCELDRVTMALLRLAKKRELRITAKIVNGKKLKAYVW